MYIYIYTNIYLYMYEYIKLHSPYFTYVYILCCTLPSSFARWLARSQAHLTLPPISLIPVSLPNSLACWLAGSLSHWSLPPSLPPSFPPSLPHTLHILPRLFVRSLAHTCHSLPHTLNASPTSSLSQKNTLAHPSRHYWAWATMLPAPPAAADTPRGTWRPPLSSLGNFLKKQLFSYALQSCYIHYIC